MPASLIGNLTKKPDPSPPGEIINGAVPATAVVGGADSVPVELHFEGLSYDGQVGVDVIFLIDNSGSMDSSDPDNRRFEALLTLCNNFAAMRDALDRIAVILFDGDTAHVEQGWKTWSETSVTADALYQGTDGSGTTPMAHGMKLANEMHIASDGFFKLVILISDGDPTEDVYTSNPVETILHELVPVAFHNRILYSTIYLTQLNPPDAHPLLWEIARGTDYITDYVTPADAPLFYFTINDTHDILSSYQSLFETVMSRIVPQNVALVEQVTNKLFIDPDAPVTFSGSGFREDQNITGFGAAAESEGVHTLEQALERFRNRQVFEIHLNELDGEVTLRFSVKLNLQEINIEDYPGDQICIEVDSEPGVRSLISYTEPTGATGSNTVLIPLPQARICFRKGISIRKSVEINEGIKQVAIDICNLDLHPVDWVEIAECPSSFVNVSNIEDDCGFHAFQMLFSNMLQPWMFKTMWAWVNQPGPYRDRLVALNASQRQQLKNSWRNKFFRAHEKLFELHRLIDQYLTRFSFPEVIPENAGVSQYWQTVHQKGIYRLITDLPPLSQRRIRFQIEDASYLKEPGSALLQWPVDATETKSLLPMSWYTAYGMQGFERIIPNPLHGQIVGTQSRSDLFTSTCFWHENIRNIRGLFIGPKPNNAWTMLDSRDIAAIWNPKTNKYGISLSVYNVGDGVSATTRVNVTSYIIPFTGEYEFPDAENLIFSPIPTLVAKGNYTLGQLAFREEQEISIYYHSFSFLDTAIVDDIFNPHGDRNGTRPARIDTTYLHAVKSGIMINLVDIIPPDGEVMVGNNQAIEIVRIPL